MGHVLKSDECELEEHEECPGTVDCGECEPPARPCICSCHTNEYKVLSA
jgi:hypothetical protein